MPENGKNRHDQAGRAKHGGQSRTLFHFCQLLLRVGEIATQPLNIGNDNAADIVFLRGAGAAHLCADLDFQGFQALAQSLGFGGLGEKMGVIDGRLFQCFAYRFAMVNRLGAA